MNFKRYPKYKDSGVEWLGKIPAHWGVTKLGFHASVKARLGWKGLKAEEYVEDGYIFLATPNIKDRAIDFKNVNYITAERYFESPEIMLQVGDVLIAKDGSTLGITNAVRDLPGPATVNSSIAVVRPHDTLQSVFLYYLLSSGFTQKSIQMMKDGQGVPHLFQADLRKFWVWLPPTEEQHAIATFLDLETSKIDALVAKKARLIELLQEKRTALITRAVTKGLDPNVPMKHSGKEWLGEIPKHWEVKRVKNISRFVTSGSRGWAEFYGDTGSLFLRIGNLATGSIDLDLSQVQYVSPPASAEGIRTRVQSGDVLISITALIGAVTVAPDDLGEAYVNQHLALVRLAGGNASSRWVAYCVLSRIGQEQMQASLYGGTKDGLGLDDIRSLLIVLPPFEEQERVVRFLDDECGRSDSLITKVHQAIDRLKEYRTALISAAVTGKIDVREEVA